MTQLISQGCRCNVCGEKNDFLEMRVSKKYSKIRHLHNIKCEVTADSFLVCPKCTGKYKSKPIIGILKPRFKKNMNAFS